MPTSARRSAVPWAAGCRPRTPAPRFPPAPRPPPARPSAAAWTAAAGRPGPALPELASTSALRGLRRGLTIERPSRPCSDPSDMLRLWQSRQGRRQRAPGPRPRARSRAGTLRASPHGPGEVMGGRVERPDRQSASSAERGIRMVGGRPAPPRPPAGPIARMAPSLPRSTLASAQLAATGPRVPFGLPNLRRNVCPHFYMTGPRGPIADPGAAHGQGLHAPRGDDLPLPAARGRPHGLRATSRTSASRPRFNQCVFYEDELTGR